MNPKTKKIGLVVVAILVFVIAVFAYKFDQPGEIPPSQNSLDWESSVTSPDIQRKHVFIKSGDVHLEADLLIPAGGGEQKGAVIFSPGSGANTYQDYFGIKIRQKYVQEVFLSRDMAVLYVNKRGMGESEGNWKHRDFQGRADDLYASVRFLKEHGSIDPSKVGLIGHSQGGWIVALTASLHKDVAFAVSLAGPATTVWEQSEDTERNIFRCEGFTGKELDEEVAWSRRKFRISASIGRFIPIGELDHYAGIIDYDPRDALVKIEAPLLMVFGENDALVPPDRNLERLDEIFQRNLPENIQTTVIKGATHLFTMVDDICAAFDPERQLLGEYSDEVVRVLRDWLTEQGY